MHGTTPPKFVLVRGLARSKEHWHGFPENLLKKMGAAELEYLDLKGSRPNDKKLFLPDLSRMVDDLRKEIDTSEPFHFVSISLGAMLALEWARKYPNEVKSVVAMNTSHAKYAKLLHRLRPQSWFYLAKIIRAKSLEEKEKYILEMTSNLPKEKRKQIISQNVDISEENPIAFPAAILQLITAATYRKSWKNIKVPVLLLNSNGDRMVDPKASINLSKKMGWKLIQHPWAGHDLPADDPQWVAEQVHNWIQRQK